MHISDDRGRPVVLKKGNLIGPQVRNGCKLLFLGNPDGTRLNWDGGDNKLAADYIRDDQDFRNLVEIIAQTHGFSFREYRRAHLLTVYMFI